MSLQDLPKINFATADPEVVATEVVATVEALLGRKLERADPLRIFLRAVETVLINQRLLIDAAAKQNLLAYATGDYLDHLGALVGCERLPESSAVTTVEITLSAVREKATTIRQGTRITADDEIFFALNEDVIILAGETTARAKATCTVAGEAGNGYAAGELDKIVDPQAFLFSMVNVTKSEGGADVESDSRYRERIHEAPEAFSCAGSAGAYIYLTKSASQLISDVGVDSETPGTVQIYPLLQGGELPGDEILQLVTEYLSARTVRPLTDYLTVRTPTQVEYDFDVSFWISRDKAIAAASIGEAAQVAAQEYLSWQRAKLGRDINPSEIVHRLKAVGVKRVEIRSPTFTVLEPLQVAVPQSFTLKFEGLEDE